MISKISMCVAEAQHWFEGEIIVKRKSLGAYIYPCKPLVMTKSNVGISELPEEWRDVSNMFVALGDEQRQRVLLTFEPGERLNVTQIVAASTLSRTAVSHHLKILRQAGALRSQKLGKEVYFWIDKESIIKTFEAVLNYVKNNT